MFGSPLLFRNQANGKPRAPHYLFTNGFKNERMTARHEFLTDLHNELNQKEAISAFTFLLCLNNDILIVIICSEKY